MTKPRGKHRSPTKRRAYRVHDPLVGILADWFGIGSGPAKILLALYNAKVPLYQADLARQTGFARASVQCHTSRLRSDAGLDVLSGTGCWHAGYTLSDDDRRAVRESFSYVLEAMGRDIPTPERVEALEAALGIDNPAPREYGLTRPEQEIFGMLRKASPGPLARERAFVALYADRLDPPNEKIIDVWVCKIRRKVRPYGYGIAPVRGVGWQLTHEELAVPVAA
jgi:biotin operon repressor